MLLFVSASAAAWSPPEDCADADRESPGNRSTPCRVSFPKSIEPVSYSVEMYYPYCFEEVSFAVPGLLKAADSVEVYHAVISPASGHNAQVMRLLNGSGWVEPAYWEIKSLYRGDVPFLMFSEGRLHILGYAWLLGSSITESSWFLGGIYPHIPDLFSSFYVRLEVKGGAEYRIVSPAAFLPSVDGVVELANACLALVQQEKDEREHAAAVAREGQEAQARIEAQADADEKSAIQARREAEAQARIAEQELAAALVSKARAAEIELIKTQTLESQIKHEEVVAGILRDIVRIRLAGQEDRARITSDYLARWEATAAEFEVETSEVETRIQQYIDFNAQLLERIADYQQRIDSRLATVGASIAEQQANIEQILQEAQQQPEEEESE